MDRPKGRLSPGARLGPYEIVGPLGAGGMGEVYRARDTLLDRDVAIKVLPERVATDGEARARFEREARLLASLHHPGILTIHGFGSEGEIAYAVMELLEGETLGDSLRSGPMALERAAEVARGIAEGLAAAHAKGVIHRDIKPDNVFLTADGTVKLLDFGLARSGITFSPEAETGPVASPTLTRPGYVVGTPDHMSPEQARGLGVDVRGDVFSFGVLLWQMLTGQSPFRRGTPADTIAAILKEDPPEPSRPIPPAWQAVLVRCLDKDPERRFASGTELLAALPVPTAVALPLPPSPSTPRRLWLRMAAGAVVVAAAAGGGLWLRARYVTIDSLAVLPFSSEGGGDDLEYLSDGLAEGVIGRLAGTGGLRVVSRTASFRFRGRDVDPQQAARALKVRAVVTGRVVRRGERLVVSVELADARDNARIWGNQMTRPAADVIDVPDEIAREIADALRVRLTGEEVARRSRRSTRDREAYDLYLRGRHQWARRTEEGLHAAVTHFTHALERDPSYALAYSGLADAYLLLVNYALPDREAMPKVRAAAEKALALDESLAEAHASLAGVLFWHEWDWKAAEREFVRSIELDPGYPVARHWYSIFLSAQGRHTEAMEQLRRAQDLDPLSPAIGAGLGWGHLMAGRAEEAAGALQRSIESDPSFFPAYLYLTEARLARGEREAAVDAGRRAWELSGQRPLAAAWLGHACAVAGDVACARNRLAELKETARREHLTAYYPALVHLGLGERDAALDELERAMEERSRWIVYLSIEPRLAPIRGNPRFQALLARAGLPSSGS